MRFFNYLFNRMKWWNTKVVLDFSPFFSAIIIMAVFQMFNILFVLNTVHYYFGVSISFFDRYYLLLPVLLFLWNYSYYRLPSRQAKIDAWVMSMPSKRRRLYDLFVVLYFVVSLFLFIWIGYLIRLTNL